MASVQSSTASADADVVRLGADDISNAVKFMTQVIRHRDCTANTDFERHFRWAIDVMDFQDRPTIKITKKDSEDFKKAMLEMLKARPNDELVYFLNYGNTEYPATVNSFNVIMDYILIARFSYYNRFEHILTDLAEERIKKETHEATHTSITPKYVLNSLKVGASATYQTYKIGSKMRSMKVSTEGEMRAASSAVLRKTADEFHEFVKADLSKKKDLSGNEMVVDDVNSRIQKRMDLIDAAAVVERLDAPVGEIIHQLAREEDEIQVKHLRDLFAFSILKSGVSEYDLGRSGSVGSDQYGDGMLAGALDGLATRMRAMISPALVGTEDHLDEETTARVERVVKMLIARTFTEGGQ